MTMKASIFKDINHFEVEEIAKPKITNSDDVLIKVLVCSICGTDVNMAKALTGGYGDNMGKIFGHELVGEVAEVGSTVKGVKPGDRVVVNPNSYCCTCDNCRNGYRNHCSNMELMGLTHPGAFAEYVKARELQVFKISDKVPVEKAAFAEPLSCAMNGFSRLDITPGDTCVVIGCGPIGLLFAQLARLNGARVCCIELNKSRQEIARKLGFTVLDPDTNENITAKLKEMWGRRANYVIDAAGRQLTTAIAIAEFCGKILCFASPRQVDEANLAPIQGKELTIMGSFIINDSMARAITVLESGVLDLDPIITHKLPLEELDKGLELMRTGEGMEIIMEIAK